MSNLKRHLCVLCKEPAERNRPWDADWDRKCAASICKLLEVDQEDLPVLFENFNYCPPCHEFIRDVDFTVRALTSLQEKSQELRTILSQILPNLDLLCASGDEEDEIDYSTADNSSSEIGGSSAAAESCTQQKSSQTTFNNKHSATIKKSMRATGVQDHHRYVTDESKDQMEDVLDLKEEHGACEYDDKDEFESKILSVSVAESSVLELTKPETRVRASLPNEQYYFVGSIELNEPQILDSKIQSVPNILTVRALKEEYTASEYADKDELDIEMVSVSEADSHVLRPTEHSKAEAETRVNASLPNDPYPGQGRSRRVFKKARKYQLLSAAEKEDSNFVLSDVDSDHHGSNAACSVMNSVAKSSPNTPASKRCATVQAQSSQRKQIKNTPTPTDDPFGSVTFSCPACKKGFSKKKRLAFHIKCSHPEVEKFPCQICEWVFYFEEDCRAHEELHQSNAYTCVLGRCYHFKVKPKDYGSLEDLCLHLKKVHEFQCEICGYMAINKPVLRNHKLIHTNEKTFFCKTCGGRFRTKRHLELHTEARHPDPNNVKVYSCQLCHEAFRSRNSLYSHKYEHHSGPNTSAFKRKTSATVQTQSSLGKRKKNTPTDDPIRSVTFSCPMCKKGFSTKTSQAFHIKCFHPEAEKFPCKICEWVFYFPEDCSGHEKLHQPNVYTCILGKCFTNRFKVKQKDYGSLNDLRLHLKEFHEFQCETCGYMAISKHSLKNHKLRHKAHK